jgi:uncharacterized membrane protein YbhN (UPF0104 family)
VIFAVFVAVIEAWLGWARLLAPWRELSLGHLLAAVAAMAVTYTVRALRLYGYFHAALRGRFRDCLGVTLIHNFWINLLPFRSGEIAFPVLMVRHFAVPVTRSVPALLWMRFLDAHLVAAIALAALAYPLLGTGAALTGLTLWFLLPPLAFRLRAPVQRFVRARHGRLWRLLHDLLDGLPADAGAFARDWAWTLVNWGVKFAVFVFLLRQLAALPLEAVLMGIVGGEVSGLVAFAGLGGVGTYEAGVVFGMVPYGVEVATATRAAVNLHVFVLGTALVAGMLAHAWMRRPKHRHAARDGGLSEREAAIGPGGR